MKKYILLPVIVLSLFGLFYAGVLQSLLFFWLTGAIPGTQLTLSPEIMSSIIVAIVVALSAGVFTKASLYCFNLYQRRLWRKKLIAIPAFRRLLQARRA